MFRFEYKQEQSKKCCRSVSSRPNRKPLQFFPCSYNSHISCSQITDPVNCSIQQYGGSCCLDIFNQISQRNPIKSIHPNQFQPPTLLILPEYATSVKPVRITRQSSISLRALHQQGFPSLPSPSHNPIQRAPHPCTSPIEHMGIYHGGRNIPVPQQFLDGPNVISTLQQVGSE